MVPVSIAATAVSARAWGLSFGHPTPDSDLDFLVIKRGVQNRRHLAQAIYRRSGDASSGTMTSRS